jgi:hypothetical protein
VPTLEATLNEELAFAQQKEQRAEREEKRSESKKTENRKRRSESKVQRAENKGQRSTVESMGYVARLRIYSFLYY